MVYSKIVLLIVLVIAMITDVKTGKIKNWLTLPAIAAGPILSFIDQGPHQALLSLEGMGVMILLCVPIVAFHVMGGGDVKLLVAVGGLIGLPLVLNFAIFTGLAGGVLALIETARNRATIATVKNIAIGLQMHIGIVTNSTETGRVKKIPYSIAIAAGTAAALICPK